MGTVVPDFFVSCVLVWKRDGLFYFLAVENMKSLLSGPFMIILINFLRFLEDNVGWFLYTLRLAVTGLLLVGTMFREVDSGRSLF